MGINMSKNTIAIDDLFNLRVIKKTLLLTDTRILFEEEWMKKESNSYSTAIYIIDTEHKKPRQFTLGITKDTNMKLSPDKRKLAFISSRDDKNGKLQLFIMHLDGGEAIQYTNVPNGIKGFNWSVDGEKIIFLHNINKEEMEEEDKKAKKKEKEKIDDIDRKIEKLKKEELEKKKKDPLVIKKIVYRVGTQYLDDRYNQIYLLDLNTKKIERITSETEANYASAVLIGNTIFATKEVVHGPLNDEWRFALVKISTKNKKEEVIREFNSYDGTLIVSPNGNYIVYSEIIEDERLSSRNQELTLYNIESGTHITFTKEIDNHSWLPKFDHASEKIYFCVNEKEHSSIYEYNISSASIAKIFENELMIYDFDIDSEKGLIVINASTIHDPSVLMLFNHITKELTVLWESNRKWLEEKIIAKTEMIEYENEGVQIQGWVVKPPEFKKNKKYPLILEIHGGPHAIWSPHERTMWFEFQFFAAQGYIIFYCNPRGSSGRGLQFRDVFANWGEGPSSDILRGVDTIVERGIVDPNKMFVTGGSYGGYMTAWIIGHDSRFKAAVPQRGVYNLISFTTTTDIIPFTKHEMGVFPWENKDIL